MSRLKLAAIGALLAGPFMLVMNFMETKEKEQIDKEGVETMAVVTEKTEKRGRKGRRSYEFAVEYLDGASTRTANVDVSKERYDSIDAVPLSRSSISRPSRKRCSWSARRSGGRSSTISAAPCSLQAWPGAGGFSFARSRRSWLLRWWVPDYQVLRFLLRLSDGP